MKFTGERYLPSEGGDIRHEHLHRYAWCTSLVKGKDVLDIACGEGYGSAMLAEHARFVTGVDIAHEAVKHAGKTYSGIETLRFKQGDAAQIPLMDNSVDVVVSFETIEHHDRHQEMLAEIRRVLRPDGLLIMSSPNRLVYSELAGYHNEFHVKELDFDEFDDLLKTQFDEVCYFGQRLAVGSSIFTLKGGSCGKSMVPFTDTGAEVVRRAASLLDPIYFVAVAGVIDRTVKRQLHASVLFSEAEDLYTHHREVAKWAKSLDAQLTELRERYTKSVADGNQVSEWAKSLAQEKSLKEHALAEALDKLADKKQQVAETLKVAAETRQISEAAIRSQTQTLQCLSASEQRTEVARRERDQAQNAWQSEKEVRLTAEHQMQAHAEAVARAQAAWQSEKEARTATERQLQAQAKAVREAQATWMDLIEARGELAKRDARIIALEHVQTENSLIKTSRSWRWTRPMRFVMRIMHAAIRSHGDDRGAADASAAGTDDRVAAVVPMRDVINVSLRAAERDKRDYFVWAVIDWHFRIQRPQHLARELAADGNRVFYISNNFIDDPAPGFSVEPLDSEGRLFQIHLHVRGKPAIYHAAPDENTAKQLRASMRELLAWTRSTRCVSLVQHPFWIEATSVLPNHRIAYDCMDHHGGFADNTPAVLARENELMNLADLLVVTSDWLQIEAGQHNPNCLMVRNACQYEHFAHRPEQVFKDKQGRKVIGYYGAIAEWFDLDLVEVVAKRFPEHLVLLVGGDTAGAQARLEHLNNVEFVGEVPYATLPFYLYAFDVCLLPFKIIPLTLATNPVKVYEYLSAGRSVVSVDLPEMRQFGDLIYTAKTSDAFVDAVAGVLNAKPDPATYARRQEFAAAQTWSHRVADLEAGIDAVQQPRVSVVVVTYNNLEYTQACLSSLDLYSDYPNLQIIVVDNASSDGTPAFLKQWKSEGPDREIILNADNRGFAAANNQGLVAADGKYLVMLNNDTYVTPGWIATLVGHLRADSELGMIGPVTNNIGNEARIEIGYADMVEMLDAAADYTAHHAGQLTPLRTAAFFCVMMSRVVYDKVGSLDEVFGIGFFEDDDYCRRVAQAGFTIACADDVFVHHNLSASFNKLKQETRQALFERNKSIYEAKWGEWVPHRYRADP